MSFRLFFSSIHFTDESSRGIREVNIPVLKLQFWKVYIDEFTISSLFVFPLELSRLLRRWIGHAGPVAGLLLMYVHMGSLVFVMAISN